MGKHEKPVEKKSIVPGELKKFTDSIIQTGDEKNEAAAKLVSAGYAGEIGIIAAAFVLAAVLWVLPLGGWARFAVFIIPLALVGYPVFIKAVDEATNLEFIKPEMIMSVAALGAMGLQEYAEAVSILGVYRVCQLLKDFVESKSRRMARDFDARWTDVANVVRDEETVQCSAKNVAIGELITVEPGERIPLDGVVVEGISSLKSDNLTGDGPVITAAPGREAVSGCINVTSQIKIRVSRSYENSVANRLRGMVKSSAEDKTKKLFIMEKIGKIFTPALVILALLIAVVPPLISGEWNRWLHCAVIFLIASEPLAVLFSVPVSCCGGIYGAAGSGIFFKHIDAIELLAKTRTMVMEKTGIVTDGEFIIQEVYTEGVSERELLNMAAAVERNTKHPIAEAVCMAGDPDAVAEESVSDYSEVPGKGVCAYIDGKLVLVGTASHLTDHNILYKVPNKPGAAIHVAVNGKYWGYFLISDRVRGKAFDALESLRIQGVSNLVMLTGDVKSSARPVASSLNFDMVKFELSPAGKISAVEYLMATDQGRAALAFVGNGTDDGPALERADVGIAFDALETYKAMDYADVIIMDENISKLPLTMKIAKFADNVALQNILAFLAAKLLILFLALIGIAGLWFAIACEGLLFAFSSLNAARTLKKWV